MKLLVVGKPTKVYSYHVEEIKQKKLYRIYSVNWSNMKWKVLVLFDLFMDIIRSMTFSISDPEFGTKEKTAIRIGQERLLVGT